MSALSAMTPLSRATAGAVCLVTLLAGAYLTGRVALGAWEETYEVEVVLGDLGQGVVRGTDVKLRGVIIGEVVDTGLTDALQAVARLQLDPGYRVPERARFAVTAKTLFGEKQIEVHVDGPVEQGPFVAAGGRIDDPARVVEVEDVLADLAELLDDIEPADLAAVSDELLGAFAGQGPTIARGVDAGSEVSALLRRTLDDQLAGTRDLSLVAEALGGEGAAFNRLGAALVAGAPTLSENQAALRALLDELGGASRAVEAPFRVARPDIDRMLVEGDNLWRLLFHYRFEVGEVVVGLRDYTAAFPEGFRSPGIQGQAGFFQILVDEGGINALCKGLPEEFAAQLPGCRPQAQTDASADRVGAQRPELALTLPRSLVQPRAIERGGLAELVGASLPPNAPGARR